MSARPIDDPKPGFFKKRLVKGGPFVGARLVYGPPRDPETGGIMEERSWMWEAWENGRLVRAPSPDPLHAGAFQIWLSGTAIDEAEYRFLVADAEWARAHAPGEPIAQPTKPVNLADLPPDHFLPPRR